MDIGKFATRENCEKGVWVEPVIFGQPTGIELCLLGADSDKVRRHNAETLREIGRMTQPEKERINYVAMNREEVISRTVGLRVKDSPDPVTLGGKSIDDTPAGYRTLYEQIPELQTFAKDFSDKRANFLPKEKTSSNEQSDVSSSSTIHTASEPETNVEQ